MSPRLLALTVLILAVWIVLWRLQLSPGSDAGPGEGNARIEHAEAPPARDAVEATLEDRRTADVSAPAGAAVPAEPAESEVAAGGEIWLLGQLLEEDGTPAADRALRAELVVHRGMSGSEGRAIPVRTDDEGRFRRAVDPGFLEHGAPQLLSLSAADGADERRAELVLPTLLSPGEHDLGEASLTAPTRLAVGRTVDLLGQPVAGATVTARWSQRVTVPPGAAPTRFLDEVWWMLDGIEARSDGDGHFELVGSAPRGALKVEARKAEYLPAEPRLVAQDAAPIELVLPQGGGLRGWVLLSEAVPRDRVRVEVRRGERFEDLRRQRLAPDGSFEVQGLSPGEATLRVLGEEEELLLAELDGLELVAGRVARDPRLDPLDLRDAVSAVRLLVRDEAGGRLTGAVARVAGGRFPESQAEWSPEESPGDLLVVGAGRKLDLLVWAPGYRAVALKGVEGEREVRLEPGPRVRARIAAAPALRADEGLFLMLEVFDGEVQRQVSLAEAPPGAEIELPASHEGRHMVSLWLTTDPRGWGRVRVQSPGAAAELVVGPDGAENVVEVTLDGEGLRAAREFLERF